MDEIIKPLSKIHNFTDIGMESTTSDRFSSDSSILSRSVIEEAVAEDKITSQTYNTCYPHAETVFNTTQPHTQREKKNQKSRWIKPISLEVEDVIHHS